MELLDALHDLPRYGLHGLCGKTNFNIETFMSWPSKVKKSPFEHLESSLFPVDSWSYTTLCSFTASSFPILPNFCFREGYPPSFKFSCRSFSWRWNCWPTPLSFFSPFSCKIPSPPSLAPREQVALCCEGCHYLGTSPSEDSCRVSRHRVFQNASNGSPDVGVLRIPIYPEEFTSVGIFGFVQEANATNILQHITAPDSYTVTHPMLCCGNPSNS